MHIVIACGLFKQVGTAAPTDPASEQRAPPDEGNGAAVPQPGGSAPTEPAPGLTAPRDEGNGVAASPPVLLQSVPVAQHGPRLPPGWLDTPARAGCWSKLIPVKVLHGLRLRNWTTCQL